MLRQFLEHGGNSVADISSSTFSPLTTITNNEKENENICINKIKDKRIIEETSSKILSTKNMKTSPIMTENNENEIQIPKINMKNYANFINNDVGYLPAYKTEKVDKISKSTNSASFNDNSNVYPLQNTKRQEPANKKIVSEHTKNNSKNRYFYFIF